MAGVSKNFMSIPITKIILSGVMVVMAARLPAVASTAQQSASPVAAEPDPQVVAALREISLARIQQTIEKLVGFYTRQTLSSDVPPISDKGINAAAVWIQDELQRISSQCGDCLEVRTDQFLQPPGPRIPQPTTITNVYAILRGTDPANAGRMYVVTGHYDSRNSDPTDATGQAP